MYLRATKTELEDAGESTEGMASNVSELRKELLALTNSKVDVMLDSKTYKSTYQILKEMAGAWSEMTDMQRAAATELMGGKRNSNVISALMTGFSTAENVMQTAANSAGSALAENEKQINSIEGKLQLLDSAFQNFSKDVLDSDLIKFFVDLAKNIVNGADGIVKMAGAAKLLVSVLSGAAATQLVGSDKLNMSAYADYDLQAA